MSEQGPEGIKIRTSGDRVEIEIAGARWEGTAGEAEQVLTGLHYAIGRARPGTNMASMFLIDGLWGGKFIQNDRTEAERFMRILVERLGELIDSMEERGRSEEQPLSGPEASES